VEIGVQDGHDEIGGEADEEDGKEDPVEEGFTITGDERAKGAAEVVAQTIRSHGSRGAKGESSSRSRSRSRSRKEKEQEEQGSREMGEKINRKLNMNTRHFSFFFFFLFFISG